MQVGRALLSTMVDGRKINCAPSVTGSRGRNKQDKNLSIFTDKIFAVKEINTYHQVTIYSTFFFPVFGDILTFQLISDIFYDCFGFEKYSMGGDLVLPKYIKILLTP